MQEFFERNVSHHIYIYETNSVQHEEEEDNTPDGRYGEEFYLDEALDPDAVIPPAAYLLDVNEEDRSDMHEMPKQDAE